MPRDASGNYTLPSPENPVVSGTVIESTWANNTMDDMAQAMTGSLSRNGSGGMLVSLKGVNGVQNAPAYSFTQAPTSGMWRDSAGTHFSVLGIDSLLINQKGTPQTPELSAIREALLDGNQYARKDGGWDELIIPPAVVVSDTPPPDPVNGGQWFNSATGRTMIWYVDVDGGQWVEDGPGLLTPPLDAEPSGMYLFESADLAGLDFYDFDLVSGYDYQVKVYGVQPQLDAVYMRGDFSIDGGTSWLFNVFDWLQVITSPGAVSGSGGTAPDVGTIGTSMINTSPFGGAVIDLVAWETPNTFAKFNYSVTGITSPSIDWISTGSAWLLSATQRPNAARIALSADGFTAGRIDVYRRNRSIS